MGGRLRPGCLVALIALPLIVALGGIVTWEIAGRTKPQIVISDHTPVDVAFRFKPKMSDDQITGFIHHQLSVPAGGDGYSHLPGVEYIGGDYYRRAVYLNFDAHATAHQRRVVLDAGRQSPLVKETLRNRTPSSLVR